MELIPFTYDEAQVRVVQLDGEPWFVAADICRVLEIGNPSQALSRLDDDERGETLISNEGTPGNPTKAIVSESGLYSLILGSRKPEAKLFKRWITHEVIPSIRKTGSYGAPVELTGPELMAKALIEAQATLTAKDEQIKQLEPKANSWARFLSSEGDMSVAEAAQLLVRDGIDMGRNRLFKLLAALPKDGGLGWIYKDQREQWRAYQAQVELDRVHVKAGTYENSRTGEQFPTTTIRLTTKGFEAIHKHLRKSA